MRYYKLLTGATSKMFRKHHSSDEPDFFLHNDPMVFVKTRETYRTLQRDWIYTSDEVTIYNSFMEQWRGLLVVFDHHVILADNFFALGFLTGKDEILYFSRGMGWQPICASMFVLPRIK